MVAGTRGNMEMNQASCAGATPPGIVIQHPSPPERRPAITAFIWGGKVAPVPALPYGRLTS